MSNLNLVPPAAPPTAVDPLRKHRLDLHAVENGKWVSINGDRWLVARLGCTAVARARAAAMASLGLAPDAEIPAHQLDHVQASIFAHAIVRGAAFEDAPDVAYTAEMGLRIWSDPELRDLRDKLTAECQGDYRQDATTKAAILGNS